MFSCKHDTGAKNEVNNSKKSGKNNAYQYSTNGIKSTTIFSGDNYQSPHALKANDMGVFILNEALSDIQYSTVNLVVEMDGDITSAEIIKCEDSRKPDYAKHPTAEQIGIFSGRVAEEVDSNLKKTTFTTVDKNVYT